MNKLIYKSFTWPRNPEHYRHSYVREPVYGKNEEGETVFTSMGPEKLTVTGSGSFFGDTAYADFQALIKVFEESTSGELVHPVWGTVKCYFTRLELTQEPKHNYVAYEFEFREADADGAIPQ